ncbi:hypothetical protein RZS08_18220, partial [Arthrospira platensis SPKY1]|nr:hypothetical protein [Arthrospira platensis SPKY1]
CGADATAAEHHITACEHLAQQGSDSSRIVPDHLCPGQRQPPLAQHLDDPGQMLVAAPAGQDFVTHDDQPEGRGQRVRRKQGRVHFSDGSVGRLRQARRNRGRFGRTALPGHLLRLRGVVGRRLAPDGVQH